MNPKQTKKCVSHSKIKLDIYIVDNNIKISTTKLIIK